MSSIEKRKFRTKYPQTNKLCNAYVICAIDLGTTYSGISYCVAYEPPENAGSGEGIKIETFTIGADSSPQISHLKSPTVLVVSYEPKEKCTIGASALRRVLMENEKTSFIIRDFKMKLDIVSRRKKEGDVLLKDTKVKLRSYDGSIKKEWSLSKVFTKYLKECRKVATRQVLSYTESIGLTEITADHINWVITVPAIWTDQARIFMREVAEKAGFLNQSNNLFSSRLCLCLEPEAAALHILQQRTDWAELIKQRILVIDLGGGTADFTQHIVEKADFTTGQLHLSEARPPSGGSFGGKLFEEAFCKEILLPLLGKEAYRKFKDNLEAYNSVIQNDLMLTKLSFSGRENYSFSPQVFHRFNLGVTTAQIVENAKALKQSTYKELRVDAKVTVTAGILQTFFDRIIDPVKKHITNIIKAEPPETFGHAFLAGGMGTNKYVYDKLAEHWNSSKTTLLRARESSLAVVCGALRYGFNSEVLGSRKSRTNYGTDVRNKGFKRLIAKGEDLGEIERRTTRRPLSFRPTKETNKRIRFQIYETENPEATKLDECILVAETKLEIDQSLPFKKRKYLVTLKVEGHVLTGYMRLAGQPESEAVRLKWSSR